MGIGNPLGGQGQIWCKPQEMMAPFALMYRTEAHLAPLFGVMFVLQQPCAACVSLPCISVVALNQSINQSIKIVDIDIQPFGIVSIVFVTAGLPHHARHSMRHALDSRSGHGRLSHADA